MVGPGCKYLRPANGDMRRVTLTAPNAVCNDGTQAVMYVRAAKAGAVEPDGPSANRWVIHFEGGGCETYELCAVRWCALGFYSARQMSSTYEPDSLTKGGLLNRNSVNRIADRNEVMLNYCSSDAWQGQKSDVVLQSQDDPAKSMSIHFRGGTITQAAIAALEQGVPGLPKLTDATDVLISGDSAGATAVRTHVDSIAARLKTNNPNVRVRAQMEATFYPDLNGRQGAPAGTPADPPFASKTQRYNADVARINPLMDESCKAAHPTEGTYLCLDNGYVELNHITTPLFQIHDIQDPSMLESLVEAGTSATTLTLSQRLSDQLAELTNIRSTAAEKASITTTPGVAARNCGVHVMWSEDDGFLGKKIRAGTGQPAYSYYDLLWNWMTGASPTAVMEPKPPASPDPPALDDAVCSAKASTSPALPAAPTASSASYDFGGPVAPESIVVTFGTNLANATAVTAKAEWDTTLGGLQVTVRDSANVSRVAPLYYVSPTQVMYLIPKGTAAGTATITLGAQTATVQVAATAPALYTANQRGTGVAAATYTRITASGARTDALINNGVPATAGDQIYLTLYGTGLQGGTATATVGDVNVPIAGPVAQPQYLGLDQINLGPLPLRIGYGTKAIVIRQGDAVANTVQVTFKAP